MPLFEVETTSHIMIACADDAEAARLFAVTNYPAEQILHVTHRPRDAWVISKKLLGIQVESDPCQIARDCLARAAGDKLHAVRLYMQATGTDLEGGARPWNRTCHAAGDRRFPIRAGPRCLSPPRARPASTLSTVPRISWPAQAFQAPRYPVLKAAIDGSSRPSLGRACCCHGYA